MQSSTPSADSVVTDPAFLDVICELGIPKGSWIQLGGPLERIDISLDWEGQWVEIVNVGDRSGTRQPYGGRHPHPVVATFYDPKPEEDGVKEATWVVCRAQIKAWKPKTAG